MLCGNKTDECPNCKKYIRRAIFAYHFENNCANLDAIENDVSHAVNQSDPVSTFQPNNASKFSSESAVGNNTYVSAAQINLATPSTTVSSKFQPSNSGTLFH
jgi:hypothetical protein